MEDVEGATGPEDEYVDQQREIATAYGHTTSNRGYYSFAALISGEARCPIRVPNTNQSTEAKDSLVNRLRELRLKVALSDVEVVVPPSHHYFAQDLLPLIKGSDPPSRSRPFL